MVLLPYYASSCIKIDFNPFKLGFFSRVAFFLGHPVMHYLLCYVNIFAWKVGDLYLVNPERVPYRSPTYLVYFSFNTLFLVYYKCNFSCFYIDKERKKDRLDYNNN